MAFQLSPGVAISEVDLTTVVPSVATTVGGIAGDFQWGPVNQVVTIGNENQLVNTFGEPDTNTANAFFTAANFLSYGNDLRVVRSIGTNGKNAEKLFSRRIWLWAREKRIVRTHFREL